jgi:hypothetical protein
MRMRGLVVAVATVAVVVGVAAPVSAAEGERDVWAFGSAQEAGDTGELALTAPLVGMAPTPGGNGYWLAAADGGVFTYGNAPFHGSAAALPLTAPIVGIAPTPTGNGYWLAAADGGVFTYGNAPFHGSAAALPLTAPIVGIAASPFGDGYWLAAADGGVFTYGNVPFQGAAAGLEFVPPFVAISAHPSGGGYWLATDGGDHSLFPGIWPHTTETEAAAAVGSDLDPPTVAVEFMRTYVGLTDPVARATREVGPGHVEVDVTPGFGGPTTTVTLRNLAGLDTLSSARPWTVTHADTSEILVDLPQPLSAVGPLAVVLGRGRAFEGHITVEVRQDGQVAAGAPLGEGFVTGGGGELLPFSGAIPFTPPTDEDAGAVLFIEFGAEDGSPIKATVIRVALPNPPPFPGGLTLLPSGVVTPLGAFNDFVAVAQPEWAADKVTTAVYFAAGPLAAPEDAPQRVDILPQANGSIEVTSWGLPDDSVEAARFRVRLAEQPDGTWRVTQARWSQKCWPGRGHQDFSTVPCI